MTRPSHLQIQLAVTLLFAMLLTAALVIAKPPAPRACQRMVIASSAEKFGMLQDFAVGYNRTAGSVASPLSLIHI